MENSFHLLFCSPFGFNALKCFGDFFITKMIFMRSSEKEKEA